MRGSSTVLLSEWKARAWDAMQSECRSQSLLRSPRYLFEQRTVPPEYAVLGEQTGKMGLHRFDLEEPAVSTDLSGWYVH